MGTVKPCVRACVCVRDGDELGIPRMIASKGAQELPEPVSSPFNTFHISPDNSDAGGGVGGSGGLARIPISLCSLGVGPPSPTPNHVLLVP